MTRPLGTRTRTHSRHAWSRAARNPSKFLTEPTGLLLACSFFGVQSGGDVTTRCTRCDAVAARTRASASSRTCCVGMASTSSSMTARRASRRAIRGIAVRSRTEVRSWSGRTSKRAPDRSRVAVATLSDVAGASGLASGRPPGVASAARLDELRTAYRHRAGGGGWNRIEAALVAIDSCGDRHAQTSARATAASRRWPRAYVVRHSWLGATTDEGLGGPGDAADLASPATSQAAAPRPMPPSSRDPDTAAAPRTSTNVRLGRKCSDKTTGVASRN